MIDSCAPFFTRDEAASRAALDSLWRELVPLLARIPDFSIAERAAGLVGRIQHHATVIGGEVARSTMREAREIAERVTPACQNCGGDPVRAGIGTTCLHCGRAA